MLGYNYGSAWSVQETVIDGPLVTHPVMVVALPCYNEERFLGQTIEALRQQTWKDFAVLISDNASTDGTEAIARAAAADDSRFYYHRQRRNLGAGANFNFARYATESSYLLWLGAHDLIAPTFLSRHLEALEANPTLSVSQSTQAWIDEEGKIIERIRDGELTFGGPNSIGRYLLSIRQNKYNTGINSVIRRRFLEGNAFANVVGTDRILLSRLAYRGPIADISEPLYFRRSFEGGRDGWTGYMERLTGQTGVAEDWNAFAEAYEADMNALIGSDPRKPLYRLMLRAMLRYYLPLGEGTIFWTIRRGIKAVKMIASLGRR